MCIKDKLGIRYFYIRKTHINTKQKFKKNFFFELIIKIMHVTYKYLTGIYYTEFNMVLVRSKNDSFKTKNLWPICN